MKQVSAGEGEVGRREQLIRTGCRARLAEMLY